VVRFHCYGCGKSVTSELPDGSVLRAIAICPECLEGGVVSFREAEETDASYAARMKDAAPKTRTAR